MHILAQFLERKNGIFFKMVAKRGKCPVISRKFILRYIPRHLYADALNVYNAIEVLNIEVHSEVFTR